MEREMYNYLDWGLTIDNPILGNFKVMVQRDFPPGSKGPYPTYSLHMNRTRPRAPFHHSASSAKRCRQSPREAGDHERRCFLIAYFFLQDNWEPGQQALVMSIGKKLFAAFDLSSAGGIRIREDESFIKWAIDILVKFHHPPRARL
ncbi:hypothetical protein B0H13DRAFT_2374429 [Mycena leptocephala]|nr:hypothetical protein B0H13DRAFT_2374429 [Mycena leptocephala]